MLLPFRKKRDIKSIIILTVMLLAIGFLYCSTRPVYAVPRQGGHDGDRGGCRSHSGPLLTLDQIPSTKAKKRKIAPGFQATTKKTIPLLVIVIGLDNMPYSDTYDWNNAIFNGDRSVTAFYDDMSFGQMTFGPAEEDSAWQTGDNTNTKDQVNDGVIHVKVNRDHGNWINIDDESDIRIWQMMEVFYQAALAASDHIDYAKYDDNNDGTIDQSELAISYVVAGYEAAIAASKRKQLSDFYMWSHADSNFKYRVDPAIDKIQVGFPKIDDVVIKNYIAIAENIESDDGVAREPICVLCHELGHYLGLPDLYNTAGTVPGAPWAAYVKYYNKLSLMADGSWGEDSQGNYCPNSLDCWSRVQLGWTDPVKVDSRASDACGTYQAGGQDYTAQDDPAFGYQVVRVDTYINGDYYLIENRSFEKWDETLGKDCGYNEKNGLILWHIDDRINNYYEADNEVNVPAHRPGVIPLYGLERNGKRVLRDGDTILVKRGVYSNTYVYSDVIYNSDYWKEACAADLGSQLYLPMYGTEDPDDPESVLLSSIGLRFLSPAAEKMNIRVHTDFHYAAGKNPTMTADGSRSHWFCNDCRKYFKDESGDVAVSKKDITLSMNKTAWTDKEKKIKAIRKDKDLAGSVFGKLRLKSKIQDKKKISLSWSKVSGASGYVVYGNRCGSSYAFKRLALIQKGSATSWNHTGLKKGTYYKYVVMAYKISNNKVAVLTVSPTIHVATKGGKVGNHKKIKVTSKTIKVKKGKKARVKAKAIPVSKSVKVKTCKGLRYELNKSGIATVTKKGVVKGKTKGTCYLYVYAQNGVCAKIKVVVK